MGEVLFVELTAPLNIRIKRAGSPERHTLKSNAPNAERVAYLEAQLNFHSPTPFFYPESYTKIDTTNKTPEQITKEIISLL